MTNRQASAHEASEPIFASAGALVFVNEYAGAAAASAPSHAFAERQLACPFSPRSPTPGGDTGRVYRKQHLSLSWASIGPMPNTMSADKLSVTTAGRAVVSTTHQRPSMRGHGPSKSRAQDTPSRWVSHSTKALSSLPSVKTRAWGCAPSLLFPSPRTAQPFLPGMRKMPPPDAALQLELLRTPRARLPPLLPQSTARRALEPRVAQRRRLGGDTVRRTTRLTRTLKNSFPHALQGFADKDPPLFWDGLAPWPPLPAAPLARRAPLARGSRAPPVRSTHGLDTRLQALQSATPRTPAAGVSAPHARLGQALGAQLRGLRHTIAACDQALAPRAQRPPAFPWLAALPGAGAVLAPRLLGACGAQRERYAAADARQKEAGSAPVPARRGKKTWGHGRWQGPTCLRQTGVTWAAASLRHAFWARTPSQPQRDKGASPQAAVRARAFQGSRLLLRCWQARTPDEESVSLNALKHRGSPLLHHWAH
jgi:hypothetical protein